MLGITGRKDMDMEDMQKETLGKKEQYVKPEMEVVEINETDTIVASACDLFQCAGNYTLPEK